MSALQVFWLIVLLVVVGGLMYGIGREDEADEQWKARSREFNRESDQAAARRRETLWERSNDSIDDLYAAVQEQHYREVKVRLVRDYLAVNGVSEEAVLSALREKAIQRQHMLLERFARLSPTDKEMERFAGLPLDSPEPPTLFGECIECGWEGMGELTAGGWRCSSCEAVSG